MNDKLPNLDRALLIRLYDEQPLAVDKLSYTHYFDKIVRLYNERHISEPAGHYEIYQVLMILRKSGKLIRKSEKIVRKPNRTLLF